MNYLTIISDGISYYDDKSINAMLIFGTIFLMTGIACLVGLKKIGFKKYRETEQYEELDNMEYDEASDDYVYGVGMRILFAVFSAVFVFAAAGLFVRAATANTMEDYNERYGDDQIVVYPADKEKAESKIS
ncbi:MAG: hypothetical protein K6C68_14025 [Ruminococcus sp.]|nr:hypothetical protein [Ruminococcus sp.]